MAAPRTSRVASQDGEQRPTTRPEGQSPLKNAISCSSWITVSRRPIAILRHPDLGVWTGPAPASTLPLVRPGPPGATPVLIDRSTEAVLTTLPSRAPEVVTAAFSPDGRRVATWSWDNVLRVWDVDSQREIAALRGHRAGLTAAVFDGTHWLVSASLDGTLLIWQLDAHEEPVVLRVDGVSAVAVSASWIAVGTRSGETQLWNRAAIAPPVIVRGHRGAISSLAFSPDASRLASTANQDRDVFIRDGTTGAELIRHHGHAGPVHSVAWHPQGQLLVSGLQDGTFRPVERGRFQR